MERICSICNKKFPSGKSLGGHMRSHVMSEARKNKKVSIFTAQNAAADGYGLRENPKKTWRISSLNKTKCCSTNNEEENKKVCKQCGKGFNSMKALYGHMSKHSGRNKDRNFMDYDDQTRSYVSRSYGKDDNGFGFGGGGGGGGDDDRSEIDEFDEQEEVAMCLMMLSRDSSGAKNWTDFDVESSDNNSSVILENSADHFDVVRSRLIDCFGFDDENLYSPKKKGIVVSNKVVKGHKCPYCPKDFKSGQALGGHMRSHMMLGSNNSEGRLDDNVTLGVGSRPSPPPEPEYKHQLLIDIDLNLPVPMEEEDVLW